jgi:hypothetical protein
MGTVWLGLSGQAPIGQCLAELAMEIQKPKRRVRRPAPEHTGSGETPRPIDPQGQGRSAHRLGRPHGGIQTLRTQLTEKNQG